MTLYDAAKHYNIYLQTLHLSSKKKETYRHTLQDIQEFYGKETALESLDESNVLDYVRVNDPFDCDPLHIERGSIFCNFIQWLMLNKMIPAWKTQMMEMQEDQEYERQRVRSHPLHPGTGRVL